MCLVWLSEQTAPFALYINNRLVFITEVESVYCAVCTESIRNTDNLVHKGLECSVWRVHRVGMHR
jgi:hypothetical protein